MLENPGSSDLIKLITTLCHTLYKDKKHPNAERPELSLEKKKKFIKKLRSQAFEILLKKSFNKNISVDIDDGIQIYRNSQYQNHQYHHHQYQDRDQDQNESHSEEEHLEEEENQFDAINALDEYFFVMKLHYRKDRRNRDKVTNYEKEYKNMKHLNHPTCMKMIEFLLKYIETEHVGYCEATEDEHILCPGPFTLYAAQENNPFLDLPSFQLNEKPIYFQNIDKLNEQQYDFMADTFRKTTKRSMLDNIVERYGNFFPFPEPTPDACSFLNLTNRLCGININYNCNNYLPSIHHQDNVILNTPTLFHLPSKFVHQKSLTITQQPVRMNIIEASSSTTQEKSSSSVKSPKLPKEKHIKTWNWENLSSDYIQANKPFASEYISSTHLHRFSTNLQKQKFQVKIMTKENFIRDLKFLTVGVASDIFNIGNDGIFQMIPDITIENCLPTTLESYVSNFLMSGTCFKRLQTMSNRSNSNQKIDGFIYKALCDAIGDYLCIFREYIYLENDDSLLGYFTRVRYLNKGLENLASLLGLHPMGTARNLPPLGAKFLTYIYEEITRISDKNFLNLLIYILRRCCHVYFKHLHRWIFYGCLDDPHDELFIGFLNHYRLNTRYFYDRSYFIRHDSVPGFVNKFEENILMCGKYTMLLKSCKPNHPLFKIEYPNLRVGLHHSDLDIIQAEVNQYGKLARKVCGPPLRICDIFERKAEKLKYLKEELQKKSKENLKFWKNEKEKIFQKTNETRKALFREMKLNMEEAQQRKVDERKARLAEDLIFQKMAEKKEMQLLEDERETLQKRISYYQDLKESIDLKNEEKLAEKELINSKDLKDVNDKSPMTPITPITPMSDEISFASCSSNAKKDDVNDGGVSDYDDCLSTAMDDHNDIIETEQVVEIKPLKSILVKNREKILSGNNLKSYLNHNHIDNILRPSNLSSLSNTLYAKSSPDINSNLHNDKESEELILNRKRMMKSRIISFDDEIIERKLDILNANHFKCYLSDEGLENRNKQTSSDILCNISDYNSNIEKSSSESLTEYRKNRKKIMSSDLFSKLEQDPIKDRAELRLNLFTDRAKNRKKVLNSEYNILISTDNSSYKGSATSGISFTDRSKNRQKILNSEYDIISNTNYSTDLETLQSLSLDTEKVLKKTKILDTDDDDDIFKSSQISINTIHSTIAEPTERAKNKSKILGSDFDLVAKSSSSRPVLTTLFSETERAKNKFKVLSTEHEFLKASNLSDKTPSPQSLTSMDTERSRNKAKVLGTEYGLMLKSSEFASFAKPKSNSIASKNKLKILGTEYDFLKSTNLNSNTAVTPMSTTSDTPLTETSHPFDGNGNHLDKDNINLHIDIPLAQLNSMKSSSASSFSLSSSRNHHFASSDASATPFSALNTAGISARQGFHFDITQQKEKRHQEILNILSEIPLIDSDSEALFKIFQDPIIFCEVPYQRTCKILASNFECELTNPFLRLNRKFLSSSMTSNSSSSINVSDHYLEPFDRNAMQSICPITITQFLQKSIVLPVKVHLNIVRNEVLRLFFEDYDLMQHFRNLKNYFFMMNGEFGSRICDGIFKRFESGSTPAQLYNYPTLHSILDNALGGGFNTAVKSKNCGGQLSFIVSDVPQFFDINSPQALSHLTLTYEVHWPLNIILSSETLEKYGDIFKFLFTVRRMDYILDGSYEYLKAAVRKYGRPLSTSPQYINIQQIRHKIHIFIKALQNHITASAIQASWIELKKDLGQAKCLEEVYRIHTAYIKKINFLCMMNRKSKDFFNILDNIFRIIIKFCKNLKRTPFKQTENGNWQYTHGRYDQLVKDEADFQRCISYMIYLGKKIVRKGYQNEIGQLIDLININDYYIPSDALSLKDKKETCSKHG